MPEASEDRPRAYNRVKALRQDAGISRSEFAAATGISVGMLASIERGHGEPRVLVASRIAGYFGLPVEMVFSEEPLAPLTEALRQLHSATGAAIGHRAGPEYRESGA